jgi:N-[(2S)-2-amino-2-carboxyethyl]-L-glutamate dehydrogenase
MTLHDQGSMRYLTRADVIRATKELDPVATVRGALLLHAEGHTTLPEEAYLGWETSGGATARSLALPAALWGAKSAIGLKIINSSLANPARGLPRAQGLTMLFDRETARPVVIMEAAYLSALRTSAYSMLSVLLLAPPELTKIAVIGCGALGESHVRMLAANLPRAGFALYDHEPRRRDSLIAALGADGITCRLSDGAEDAVRDAGVVVTTTTTTTGYIPYAWLAPGALIAHVSLDDVLPDVVRLADLTIVDDWSLVSADSRRLLGRMYRSGELLGTKGEAFGIPAPGARQIDATLADVVAGRHPGRQAPEQIILSNPFGMGILDVALAAEVLRVAGTLDLGVTLSI